MNKAEELFDELLQYHHAEWTAKQRYSRLYNLLDRVCKELTCNYAAEYTSLFARLYALCNRENYPHRTPIELFRINALRVRRGEYTPNPDDYRYDLRALCDFISFFCKTPLPIAIRQLLPDGWREFPQKSRKGLFLKRVRFAVSAWDDCHLFGHADDFPTEVVQQVDYHIGIDFFGELPHQIYAGAQLNLLEVTIEEHDDTLCYYPQIIVLEPDYLIDISTLTACVETYGASAANYLVRKLSPNLSTRHTLLGNAANQFLDDLVNESPQQPATWRDSISRNFRDYLLDYSVCPDVDTQFFKDAQEQFEHIRSVIANRFQDATVDISRNEALLEPSFFCESLGLQGRMDLMLNDFTRIIELKGGKCEEFGGHRGKETHSLQMALYKEILYYNLNQPHDRVRTFLFYSRYPHLFEQRSSRQQIQRIIALRNAIVHQERLLRTGQGLDILSALTPEQLNQKHASGKLWKDYQEPVLRKFLQAFHQASPTELAYFNRFLQFMQLEQFLGKVGDTQPDSGRGFAETWNTDVLTKQANGNILIDLLIERFDENRGIERIVLNMPDYDDCFLPNFREGDFVILYERNSETDLAINRIVHRCCIEQITPNSLTLKLNHKQRNPIVFHRESLYAVEHDHMDATLSITFRGLYAFLSAPQRRKEILLCQRAPQTDFTHTLNGRYGNQVINTLVLQAKQAEDYYLLVGPPGTGKTSVALKAMVQEFYSDPNCQLLLVSYTNRAVDEICKMLSSIQPQPPYLRIGTRLNCDPAFHPQLLVNKAQGCQNRQQIVELFRQHRIIVGTVASISSQMESLSRLKQFDVALIDEASQILEPHLLTILSAQTADKECAVRKFIMIGDHKQLPAVVLQRTEDSRVSEPILHAIGLTDCRNSLFERLYRWQLEHPTPNITATLLKQGRMHPTVAEFANRSFYHGALQPVPVPHQQQSLEFTRHGGDFQEYIATHRIGFLHSGYPIVEESNKCNRGEAQIVAALVGTIHALCQQNGLPFNAAERIGIIVPFRGQIAMIRKELAALNVAETNQITIDTVERFQGSQRDIIIFSTTISQPYQLDILSAPVEIEGQQVDRKLNVALTRARKQVFVVGNALLLSRNPLYKALIDTFGQ